MKMRLSITLKLSLVWFVLAGMVLGRYTEPAFLIIATLFIMLQLNKVYVSTSCLFVGTLFFFHSFAKRAGSLPHMLFCLSAVQSL